MLGIKEAQEIIPHRRPSLLAGYVEELEPGVRIVSYECVTSSKSFFARRFPGEPMMSDVLAIGALAQVGSAAILNVETYKGKIGYFGAINNTKLKQMARPGGKFRLEYEIIKQKGPVGIGKATAMVDDKLTVSAELTFMIG